MKIMPIQKPGQSKQNYGTPKDLIKAVENKFGKLSWDLAAEDGNAKTDKYLSFKPGNNPNALYVNSLEYDWNNLDGNLWLNPPFGNISAWSDKCAMWAVKNPDRYLAFLVPASVGSNWFIDYVYPFSHTLILKGRLTFEGCTTPYPKDCILAIYNQNNIGTKKISIWDWKLDI